MSDLVKDWLLDPTALLFLTSLLLIVLLIRGRRGLERNYSASSHWPLLSLVAWLAIFLVCSAPSIVNPLLTTLEDRYPESISCGTGSHLVVLGGGVDSTAQSATEFEHMSSSTMARASASARIAIAEPTLRLLAAGGALRNIAEADVIAAYWIALGIDEGRIIREQRSSSTRENALYVSELLSEETVEGPVRLVTSAMHMPRALNAFRAVLASQSVEVCPVSVDRESLSNVPLWASMPQTTALVKFDKWLHEVVALAIYRLRGWV